ncbi:MAG: hypothetical protein WC900_10515, partial [Oscillospiraceae bacterium]
TEKVKALVAYLRQLTEEQKKEREALDQNTTSTNKNKAAKAALSKEELDLQKKVKAVIDTFAMSDVNKEVYLIEQEYGEALKKTSDETLKAQILEAKRLDIAKARIKAFEEGNKVDAEAAKRINDLNQKIEDFLVKYPELAQTA